MNDRESYRCTPRDAQDPKKSRRARCEAEDLKPEFPLRQCERLDGEMKGNGGTEMEGQITHFEPCSK